MKLIVGLGNPGKEYSQTRHNVGFDCIDEVIGKIAPNETSKIRFSGITTEAKYKDHRILLLKPSSFMNRSGESISQAIKYYKISVEDGLLVIVDDIALPCGSIRLRPSGSSGGHNGLNSIEQLLKTNEYSRLRIGIDSPGKIPQNHYVLGKFRNDQKEAIKIAINKASEAALFWSTQGAIDTMNLYNTRSVKSEAKEI